MCYRDYLLQVQDSIPANPKFFWSYARSLKATNDLPRTIRFDGQSSDDPGVISNYFAEYFSSVFTNTQHPVPSVGNPITNVFASCSFHLREVEDCLINLDISKGCGLDNIPPNVLKHCADVLAPHVQLLFNHSLASGVFPEVLKRSCIVPIHKSGPKDDVCNFRPISILSALSKIFEKLVLVRLAAHVRHWISPHQHGFMPGRSTTTNLLALQSQVLDALRDGLQVDAVYLDFAKAFDRVGHELLVAKLETAGVSGNMLAWFGSYLINRPLQVKFLGSLSREFVPTSGVPQGSLLGPQLFNIFINDLVSLLGDHCLLFADDLKIGQVIRNSTDCHHLQAKLDAVSGWCVRNGMELNVGKCSIISFSRKKNPVQCTYLLNGAKLARVEEVRDLGIIVNSSLSWDGQISSCTGRALRTLGFVLRSSRDFTDIRLLKTLFCALVLPHLEYGCSVWSPYQEYLKADLQGVLNKFLRAVGVRLGFAYREVPLQAVSCLLGILPLEARREVHDAMLVFRLVNAQIDCSELLGLLNFRTSRQTRSRDLFARDHLRTNYLLHAPLPRAQRLINALPAHIDIFNASLAAFRKSVVSVKWGGLGAPGVGLV